MKATKTKSATTLNSSKSTVKLDAALKGSSVTLSAQKPKIPPQNSASALISKPTVSIVKSTSALASKKDVSSDKKELSASKKEITKPSSGKKSSISKSTRLDVSFAELPESRAGSRAPSKAPSPAMPRKQLSSVTETAAASRKNTTADEPGVENVRKTVDELESFQFSATPLQLTLSRSKSYHTRIIELSSLSQLELLDSALVKVAVAFQVLRSRYDSQAKSFKSIDTLAELPAGFQVQIDPQTIESWEDVEQENEGNEQIVLASIKHQSESFLCVYVPPFLLDSTSTDILCALISGLLRGDQLSLKPEGTFVKFAQSYEHDEEAVMRYGFEQLILQEVLPASVNKKTVEQELELKRRERQSLSEMITSLQQQRQIFAQHLEKERSERKALEELYKGGDGLTYVDSVTGELIVLTAAAKRALFRSVLGEEAAKDSIVPLFMKHEISAQTMEAMNAKAMSLEQFLTVDHKSFDQMKLITREKKKVAALAEYCRERVKEAAEQQRSIKVTMERKIQKLERDIANMETEQQERKATYEQVDRLILNLEQSKNPTKTRVVVEPIFFDPLRSAVSASTVDFSSRVNLRQSMQLQPTQPPKERRSRFHLRHFTIGKSIVRQMQEFATAYGFAAEGKQALIETITLSCFGILVKHIMGKERFLIGLISRLADDGEDDRPLFGPCTALVPLRMDFTLAQQFSDLCENVHNASLDRQFQRANATWDEIVRKAMEEFSDVNAASELLVQFDYVNEKTARFMQAHGALKPEGVDYSNDAHFYQFRLQLVPTDDSIDCCLFYDSKLFADQRADKWVNRYLTLLESFQLNNRSLSIPKMVSRFYQDVWTSSEQL